MTSSGRWNAGGIHRRRPCSRGPGRQGNDERPWQIKTEVRRQFLVRLDRSGRRNIHSELAVLSRHQCRWWWDLGKRSARWRVARPKPIGGKASFHRDFARHRKARQPEWQSARFASRLLRPPTAMAVPSFAPRCPVRRFLRKWAVVS